MGDKKVTLTFSLSDFWAGPVRPRHENLHVQISEESKAFLDEVSQQAGVGMGFYLDKLLAALRENHDG